jgi:hypothetical protein
LHRIDIPSAALSLPAPAAYGTPGFFQAGNPLTATDATIVDADWANAVQEELVGAVVGAGLTLDKADRGQLLAAIRALSSLRGVQTFLASGNFTVPVGVTTIEVELWAGGSGSWASIVGVTGGAGVHAKCDDSSDAGHGDHNDAADDLDGSGRRWLAQRGGHLHGPMASDVGRLVDAGGRCRGGGLHNHRTDRIDWL